MAYPCTSSFKVDWEVLQTRISVRCRRCKNCLLARQFQWQLRAAHEQMRARRTWFITLTFGPKSRSEILSAASAMPKSTDQQARLASAAGWYVSTFLKLVRSRGFVIRYLMIPEPHRDGFPHFHGLIHDQLGTTQGVQILKRDRRTGERRLCVVCPTLEKEFTYGWVDTELVRDLGAIRYVTKYIAKGRFGRIRASARYGALEPVDNDSGSVCVPTLANEVSERERTGRDVSLREV